LGAQLKNPSTSKHNSYIWGLVQGRSRTNRERGEEERGQKRCKAVRNNTAVILLKWLSENSVVPWNIMVPTKVKSKSLLNLVFFALFFA